MGYMRVMNIKNLSHGLERVRDKRLSGRTHILLEAYSNDIVTLPAYDVEAIVVRMAAFNASMFHP
jgi:hypothetical protein